MASADDTYELLEELLGIDSGMIDDMKGGSSSYTNTTSFGRRPSGSTLGSGMGSGYLGGGGRSLSGGITPGIPPVRQDLIDAKNLEGVRALMGENSDMKSRLGRATGRATRRRAGRVGKIAGAGGAAGLAGKFSKMGLGGKLMMGAGTIGTALMVFQLLAMLGEGATANSSARGLARDDSQNAFANTRGSMDRGRDQDRLKISQNLRSSAMRNDNEYNSRPASRELRNIMTSDPTQLYKLRQQMAPSMREAMARSGLYA